MNGNKVLNAKEHATICGLTIGDIVGVRRVRVGQFSKRPHGNVEGFLSTNVSTRIVRTTINDARIRGNVGLETIIPATLHLLL